MEYEYYEHWRGSPPGEVYTVTRFNPRNGNVEVWYRGLIGSTEDVGWVKTYYYKDEIVGGEPGARWITKEQAEAHIASGKLTKWHPNNAL